MESCRRGGKGGDVGFVLPHGLEQFWLAGVKAPASLLRGGAITAAPADLVEISLLIEGGRLRRIVAGMPPDDSILQVAGEGRVVLPRLVDIHTHLDKGFIQHRTPNPDGTFFGAREAVMRDREAYWTADDLRARMSFGLECAFHHGTGAIRTHLDSIGKQTAISWPVFSELRAEWAGRIELQATCLFPVVTAADDVPEFEGVLKHVVAHGGVLGAVTFLGEAPDARLDAALRRMVDAASAHGLDLDFHVDESDSPDARSLERIADVVLEKKFTGKVMVGHCCSLALMADQDRARVIDKLGEAKIAVVSLPMCNMYLQDRISARTPRWRGVAPLHELDAAGVSTMVSSDNTRDPFYAYGDLDGVEVYREATRILHFDHSERPWLGAISARPAAQMRLDAGTLAEGGPANLILFNARSLNELLCRPQQDRLVLVNGKPLATSLPDYARLDQLLPA